MDDAEIKYLSGGSTFYFLSRLKIFTVVMKSLQKFCLSDTKYQLYQEAHTVTLPIGM